MFISFAYFNIYFAFVVGFAFFCLLSYHVVNAFFLYRY